VSNVEFEDYSIKVKTKLHDCAIAFLHEVGGELKSRVHRNYDPHNKSEKTSGSFEHFVDESGLVVHVGSNYPNAIWEEFGTGKYASNKDGSPSGKGRKGYWVFVDDGGASGQKSEYKKNYTLEEAKKIVAIMRSKGLNAYYTNGKRARRPFTLAFESIKRDVDKIAKERFGDM
jgi:N-acetylmuramoyl-L-alanine amidase